MWMLRFAQHDKKGTRGCFTTLRFVQNDKTNSVIPSESAESSAMWMLHFVQLDNTDRVIPSACEESSMDASLRSA